MDGFIGDDERYYGVVMRAKYDQANNADSVIQNYHVQFVIGNKVGDKQEDQPLVQMNVPQL